MWHRGLRRQPNFLVRFCVGLTVTFVVGLLLPTITGGDTSLGLLALPVFLFLYLPLSSLYQRVSVKLHDRAMHRYAEAHALTFAKTGTRDFIRELGSIDELNDTEGQTVNHLLIGPDWKYGDLSFRTHLLSGAGKHTGTTVYYSVMSTQLSRDLPNIIFDSKKARGRQFRLQFAKKQVHRLEGDFNTFFATYFPHGYTIDSMSFISPEVMWAMRNAADYDIEIYGDRLFLYGSVYDPERQIPDMAAKLLAIKKELADNINTYRDDRLPYTEGRQRVSVEGAKLTMSLFWPLAITIGMFAFYILSTIF